MEISLSNLLFDRAARDPTRPAILAPDEEISYGEVASEAAALSMLLVGIGLKERRIAIFLPNIPRFAVIFHGILAAGGSAVMINPLNSPREVAEQLLDAGAEAVFTIASLRGLVPLHARILLVDQLPSGITALSQDESRWFPLPQTGEPPDETPGGSREAAILFTAGEAGRSRGAVLTHRNLIANLHSTMEALRLDENDRVLAALPQVHAFGLTVSLNATLAAGAAIVPVERFHPLRALGLIATTRTTVFAGVPAMFMGILSIVERNPIPQHALRITLSGGAPIHPDTQARWEERFGIALRQGYGLTEASPVCLFNAPDRPNRLGSLGHPLPRVEVTIQDGAGTELPDGEVGEICVRGENVFPGYIDEASPQPLYFRQDWLRTGDLGSRDSEGYLHFRGILKAMFTRSGFNVYPREVERAIAGDPRVWRVRATAQPDPDRENDIVLEVEPAPGSVLTEDDVREICKARLATYKQPAKVLIV